MGLEHLVLAVLILGGLGAYYYFKVGRLGGAAGYMRHKLGLQEGEEIAQMYMSYYDPDLGMLESLTTRGVNYMVAITTTGRLCIGNNEKSQAPITFRKGEVQVSLHTEDKWKMAGPTGSMEPADVFLLTPSDDEPFRLLMPRSGGQALIAWAR